jgi:hypothetical protein
MIKLAKGYYKNQKILAAGILISKQLVMTTHTNIINEKKELYHRLAFVSNTNNLEYSVESVFILSHPTRSKTRHLNACLLTLE